MKDKTPKTEDALERSSKLPDEILGAHEARSDLLKWKFLLLAALGAAGFGLNENGRLAHVHLLLALIPFVCIYVDLLCTNLNVRMIVIGTFYARYRGDVYERFTHRNRDVFQMEDWALYYSTYGVCIILAVIGLLWQTFDKMSFQPPPEEGRILILTGLIGIVLYRLVSFKVSKGLIYSMYVVCSIVALIGLFSASFQRPSTEDAILFLAGLAGFGLSLLTNFRSGWLIQSLIAQIDAYEVQNLKMAPFLRPDYSATELKTLHGFLVQKGVFIFQSLPNGLFPAAASTQSGDVSGYQNVWVRDNVHIAHAHYACGYTRTASRTLCALMRYFQKYRRRFRDIITDQTKTLAADPMKRPHIRFDGDKLEEINQTWAHAQNDALGYFLWCYCKLACEGIVNCSDPELECLAEFPLYFEAIEYWRDQDSGHWEEERKVEASSIGTVVAGLREFERLMAERQLWGHPIIAGHNLSRNRIGSLREQGMTVLDQILPCESIAPESCYRRYDSALLFLIYPLEVLSWDKSRVILEDIKTHLQGEYGIRRYLGDSYWFPDYKKVPASKRTADFSNNMETRDASVRPGEEAQWCIFDSIISVIYGKRHLELKRENAVQEANEFLQLQTAYFNRALGQLTGKSKGVPELRAPEAYYLEKGHYVPNDHTPLFWSQANLWLAMNQMQQSVQRSSETDVGTYEI